MYLWLWLLLRSVTNQSSLFLSPPTPSWLTGSVTNQVLRSEGENQSGWLVIFTKESLNQLVSIRSEQTFKNSNKTIPNSFFHPWLFLCPWLTSLFIFMNLSLTQAFPRTVAVSIVLFLFSSSLPKVSILTSDWILWLQSYVSLFSLRQ